MATTIGIEDSTESEQSKAQNSGYLSPPDITGQVRDYTLNSYVAPYEKPLFPLHSLEASEHRETARGLDLFDIHGRKFSSDAILTTVHSKGRDVPLNFGDIIALAGDFYTNREGKKMYFPICDAEHLGTDDNSKSTKTPEQRFECAVNSLTQDTDGYLAKVQDLLDTEHHTVKHALDIGDSVARAYHDGVKYTYDDNQHCHIPTDREFFDSTSNWFQPPIFSMYSWIAYTNIDHFGDDAVMAYCVGHTSALKIARKALNEPSDEEKMAKLSLAYVYEAFAAHYLTDLFSSGHLRSPRRQFHSHNYYQMALAGLQGSVPIWDFQNRFMHDDDSATGILVQNRNGDQWIEYGDKQFFEPQACVNRARCMDCLRKSAKEVYQIGYENTSRGIGSWNENQSWFAAMKLIPQPMTALAPQNWLDAWGGYDMHNPAPLWLASNPKADVEDGWTLRRDINDHSNFGTRVNGSLRNVGTVVLPKATKECQAVKDASFLGSDQFPVQSVIRGLLSGGFIQIQDLNAGSPGKGTCVNFWSPAEVEILDKTHDTFTLRNRLIDENIAPDPEGEIMHWMRGPDYGMTPGCSITGFSWVQKADGKGDIVTRTNWYQPVDYKMVSGVSRVSLNLNPNSSWAMRPAMSTEAVVILKGLPFHGCSNLTRFAKGRFIDKPHEGPELDMLALTQMSGKGAEIGIYSMGLGHCVMQNHVDDLSLGAAYGFVKTFRGIDSSKDSVILVRGNPKHGSMFIDLAKVDFDISGKPSLQKWAFDFKCKNISQDPSVLVGDALGLGYQQVIIMALNSENVNIAIYGSQNRQDADIKCCGMLKCSLSQDMKLTQPIFTALVPTCTTNPGLDILQLSRHQNGTQVFLIFRTYCRADPQPGVAGEEAHPFTKCKESTPVLDNLASRSPEHYFSIKWMSARYQTNNGTQCHGILEIFSWYGVLGARLFGAGKKGIKYELIGQLPHLGQTSIGAGLGCYGDWGHGFVTWEAGDEWIDANLFIPSDKKDRTIGSWGMKWEDSQRPRIRGWDVENRLLR